MLQLAMLYQSLQAYVSPQPSTLPHVEVQHHPSIVIPGAPPLIQPTCPYRLRVMSSTHHFIHCRQKHHQKVLLSYQRRWFQTPLMRHLSFYRRAKIRSRVLLFSPTGSRDIHAKESAWLVGYTNNNSQFAFGSKWCSSTRDSICREL